MSSVRKSTRARHHPTTGDSTMSQARLDQCTYPRTGRRGAPQVFPRKLFQILEEVDEDVISWTNGDGKSFIINDMDTFTEKVLLNYFRHQKYSSFQRQLNLYGFHKICKGPETGAYAHECFLRDQPQLLMGVRRLPQRPSSSSKPPILKQSHKIKIPRPSPPKQKSTFARLSCLTKKKYESSDDSLESEYEESDSESSIEIKPLNLNQFPSSNPSIREIEESLDECLANEEADSALLFEFGTSEIENLNLSNEDGIVNRQPIAKDIVIAKPTSSYPSAVVDIAEAVTSMVIDNESPSVTIRKTVQFQPNQNWAVKNKANPTSPHGGLQWMIPVLGRAGSSALVTKDIKYLNEILGDKEESKFEECKEEGRNRFQSTSIDSLKDFGIPQPSVMNRMSSELWNVNIESLSDYSVESVFGPQPLEMQR